MIISVINHTNGEISDAKLHQAIRAINRQIEQDFRPFWHMGASLRLEGRSTPKPVVKELPDMRGDAVIYVWNGTDGEDALGYHEKTHRGVPYGFVFTRLAKELGENWTATLSHEALEMIGDPEVNLLVQGPHPKQPSLAVFHWYEMCDAVQAETYEIDGVEVSNFVLPLYFTGERESGSRNDFLGTLHKGRTLESFGINPGGYVGFYNPKTEDHETVSIKGDRVAAKRLAAKAKFGRGRRGARYMRTLQGKPLLREAPVKEDIAVLRRSGPAAAAEMRRK